MNKCIVFFVVLVLVLVVAVITDKDRAASQENNLVENNLVEHKVDKNTNRTLVENKAIRNRGF